MALDFLSPLLLLMFALLWIPISRSQQLPPPFFVFFLCSVFDF
jgi:hypothetical protein